MARMCVTGLSDSTVHWYWSQSQEGLRAPDPVTWHVIPTRASILLFLLPLNYLPPT
jgi:hypothetical protein